jgi:hypothetical protein
MFASSRLLFLFVGGVLFDLTGFDLTRVDSCRVGPHRGCGRVREAEELPKPTMGPADGSEVQIHVYGNATAGPYKSGNNAHVHKDIGRHGQPGTVALNDRGLPSTDPAATHIGIANPADFPTVAGRAHGT